MSKLGLSERPTPETDAYLARISERRATWDTPEQWAQACQAMTDHARRLEQQRDELLKLAAVSYELASYANESKLTNQPEFLEGLFERIAAFEHAHTVAMATGKEVA
jgi:hypothetical protein